MLVALTGGRPIRIVRPAMGYLEKEGFPCLFILNSRAGHMANLPPNMVHCGGCGADFNAADRAEVQAHSAHIDDVKIEQA